MRSTFVSLLLAVTINIISYYICKWLDLLFLGYRTKSVAILVPKIGK